MDVVFSRTLFLSSTPLGFSTKVKSKSWFFTDNCGLPDGLKRGPDATKQRQKTRDRARVFSKGTYLEREYYQDQRFALGLRHGGFNFVVASSNRGEDSMDEVDLTVEFRRDTTTSDILFKDSSTGVERVMLIDCIPAIDTVRR